MTSISIATFFKKIWGSWQENILFFSPKNLQKFFLVTVKSVIETYKILLIRYWYIFTPLLLIFFIFNIKSDLKLIPLVIFVISYSIIPLTVMAVARPSIANKNFSYMSFVFRKYFLYYSLLIFIFYGVFFYLINSHVFLKFFGLKQEILALVQDPIFIFISLFLLDSGGYIKRVIGAPLRGFAMILYNMPIFLLINILWIFCAYLLSFFISLLPQSRFFLPDFFEFFILAPFFYCLVINFYTIRLHEQFKVYYDVP